MEKKIDHRCTDQPTCPWCGCVGTDDEPIESGEVWDCNDCDKQFKIEPSWSVIYTTEKIERSESE